MTAPLAFVDTETTGLDPDRHEVWEVAVIRREPDGTEDVLHLWRLPNLTDADPGAMRVNRFYERASDEAIEGVTAWRLDGGLMAGAPQNIAHDVAVATAGAHLVGAVPSFDAAFLDRFLRQHGRAPAWHYHLIDVEALAVGYLNGLHDDADDPFEPPWNSDDLTAALGLDPPGDDRHTALGDARWARAIYDRVVTS